MKSRNRKSATKQIGSALLCSALSLCLSNAAYGAAQPWSTYCEQGDQAMQAQSPTQAVGYYRKAVSLVQKSKDPVETDKCLMKLASALTLVDQAGEARSILESMLARVSKAHGAESAEVQPVLMQLGSIEESAGNHTVAMEYYNRALHLTEKHYGPYSPIAATALHGLGRVYAKTGNRDAAVSNYKRAITILSNSPNDDAAAQLQTVMHNYKDLIQTTDSSDADLIKDFQNDILKQKGPKPASDGIPPEGSDSNKSQWQQQSEAHLKASRSSETGENESVALRGIHLPGSDSDSSLKPAFKVVSDSVFSESRYRTSEAQYQRMIATDIDSLGPNHPSVANDVSGLAQLYIAQGRYSEAKPLLQRALSIYHSVYGDDNVLTINATAALASVEFQMNNISESTRLYRLALTSAQSTLGPNSLETARILNGLAYLYFNQGELDKSCTFYEWAVASTERAVGETNPLLAACLKDYAQVLRRLDKTAKASEIEQRAGQILAQSKRL